MAIHLMRRRPDRPDTKKGGGVSPSLLVSTLSRTTNPCRPGGRANPCGAHCGHGSAHCGHGGDHCRHGSVHCGHGGAHCGHDSRRARYGGCDSRRTRRACRRSRLANPSCHGSRDIGRSCRASRHSSRCSHDSRGRASSCASRRGRPLRTRPSPAVQPARPSYVSRAEKRHSPAGSA
jgi:hypothetical protein